MSGYVVLCLQAFCSKSQLQTGFYSSTCPTVEGIVRSTVEAHYNSDPTIAPGLLRLHFHDCFVQGCDGSVLISGPTAERAALQNLGLRGFDVVDDAKTQIESICPGVVSCADVLALAARDAVDLRQKFAVKGLDDHDLVTLVGAHTIGQTDCRFFQYRIYNFTATGNSDPSINQAFLTQLQTMCPKTGNGLNKVPLDKDTPTKFDVSFFKNIKDGNGVLESDQRLWSDDATKTIVQNYAGNLRGLLGLRFTFDFPKAMIKMSNIDVKTGINGEIRNICSKFN
ncbi:hypothetical protein RND81_08G064000 [Saponaria officinalis]|uniref:Peroxidase n=1 Tax=Saponaria officinalis TaxID=3572 RepID=A0AAW1J4H4_SAPOF